MVSAATALEGWYRLAGAWHGPIVGLGLVPDSGNSFDFYGSAGYQLSALLGWMQPFARVGVSMVGFGGFLTAFGAVGVEMGIGRSTWGAIRGQADIGLGDSAPSAAQVGGAFGYRF
jgi:hypothetical protein